MKPPSAPSSEQVLIKRVHEIAGLTLGELATRLGRDTPCDVRHAKGWAGQLIEVALGASAGSRPEPDFQRIGVELKTLPVNDRGHPVESTYVCTVPLVFDDNPTWERSLVYHKLARVLWVPIEGHSARPLAARRIGMGLLWSPNTQQWQRLRSDWEEFMDLICLGQVEVITAHMGECLQIRPKAADSHARRAGVNEHGEPMQTLPRGFYLRSRFTARILADAYALP